MSDRWETLENFMAIDDITALKEIVKKFVENFPEIKYLILCGEKGTGKSHLSTCIEERIKREKGEEKVLKITPGANLPSTPPDLLIVENVNFFDDTEYEKLKDIIKNNPEKNYLITYRGKCDEKRVEELKSLLGERGDYFQLPLPLYEVKRAIVERYTEFLNLHIKPSTQDIILEKLEWPQPLRFIEMMKTQNILLSKELNDLEIISLITEFQSR